jgi:hypothetical protein
MKKIIIILAASLAISGCTVPANDTVAALEEQGYRDVKVGGFAMFGCSEGDTFTRTWEATAQNGSRVKGVACGGWFKGITIRRTGRAR